MRFSCLSLFLMACLISPLAMSTAAELDTTVQQGERVPFKDLPDEIKEKILDKIKNSDQLPDEVKEKLLKATQGESDEESDEEDSDDADEEKEEGDKDEKAKEKKQDDEPSKSDRVKELKTKMQEMDTEFKFKVAEYNQELVEQRLAIEKAKLDRVIQDAATAEKTRVVKMQLAEMKLEQSLIEAKAKLATAKHSELLRKLAVKKSSAEALLATRAVEQKLDNVVLDKMAYTDKPYSKGILTVSDRRIELNGPIMGGSAKYVSDRIHYYNNESDKPIFLIIDASPGGSGLEGLHILQAMKNSDAPIHVVVKRYAASMAAIITTLADQSYAYPNAIILHHQASSSAGGNTTQQREQLDSLLEMSARLMGDVADKIGLTEKQFVKQMYENRSTGDWDLFADEAVKRGWVGNVVEEIRETAIRKRPTGSQKMAALFGGLQQPEPGANAIEPGMDRYEVKLEEQVDAQGKRYVRLPRLSPIDHWFLYSPDQYYRN